MYVFIWQFPVLKIKITGDASFRNSIRFFFTSKSEKKKKKYIFTRLYIFEIKFI